MVQINDNFLQLQNSYLFSDIGKKVAAFRAENPDARMISMGIGDVSRPLTPAVIAALHKAVDEMASAETFRGYGPEQGYGFLAESIIRHDYAKRGIRLEPDEVFINDGAKSDLGNIGDILGRGNRVAITDPVYPVYIDTNVMAGRAGTFRDGRWNGIVYLPCRTDNRFVPALPETRPDIIYLCYPNNPTGTTLTREELKKWVDYARNNRSLILFDSAYEAYITEPDVPHSIYEIPGAEKVAIEFRSFSKTAGFTGLRCGYTVIPKAVTAWTEDGREIALNPLWNRRQCTKFNGTPYIVQRAAEAVYSEAGEAETLETIGYYLKNASIIRKGLQEAGLETYGGVNAPYIWLKTPQGMSSWDMFDRLLHECRIVCTPGVGFGPSGEGFLRLTAFGDRNLTEEAVERIVKWNI